MSLKISQELKAVVTKSCCISGIGSFCYLKVFQELEAIVTKRLEKDGMLGMAVAGNKVISI